MPFRFPDADPKEEVVGYKRRLKSHRELQELLIGVIDVLLKLQIPLWDNQTFKEPLIGNPFLGETTSTEMMEESCRHLRDHSLPDFLSRYRDHLSQHQLQVLHRLIEKWPPLYSARTRSERALTFCQTDFHVHNVLHPNDSESKSLVLFDFGDYTKGVGTIPIVHFLAISGLTQAQRREAEVLMLRPYHDGLLSSGISGYSWDHCE